MQLVTVTELFSAVFVLLRSKASRAKAGKQCSGSPCPLVRTTSQDGGSFHTGGFSTLVPSHPDQWLFKMDEQVLTSYLGMN